MATKKVYDLAVVTGTYPGQDGKPKNKYQTVGAVLEKDGGGKFIMLERWFNPAGIANPDNRSTVLLSMFEPREQAPQQQSYQAPQQQAPAATPGAQQGGLDDFDDDIPF